MTEAVYDLGLELVDEWPPLFEGQLQLWPSADTGCDGQPGGAMQDWASPYGSPGDQVFSQTPPTSLDLLHGSSIWDKADSVLTPSSPQTAADWSNSSSIIVGKNDHIFTSSPAPTTGRPLSLSSENVIIFTDGGYSTPSLLDVVLIEGQPLGGLLEMSGIDLQPLITKVEFGGISSAEEIPLGDGPYYTSADLITTNVTTTGVLRSSSSRSVVSSVAASEQRTIWEEADAVQYQDDVGILEQEEDPSCALSVELENLDYGSLPESENVCDFLRRLTELNEYEDPLLSKQPLSPEDVESVLLEVTPLVIIPEHVSEMSFVSDGELTRSASFSSVTSTTTADSTEGQRSSRKRAAAVPLESILKKVLAEDDVSDSSESVLVMEYLQDNETLTRSSFASADFFEPKRQKKKDQNKSAASRYRQKKREEKGVALTEVDQLQAKNVELKGRVDELNRELAYLRALLEEINNA